MAWSHAVIALHLLAGKWTLPILAQLRNGALRPADLRNSLDGGLSFKILQESLRHLEQAGLVQRHVMADSPPRVEYQVTLRGRSLISVLDAIEPSAMTVLRTGVDGDRNLPTRSRNRGS